MSVVEERNGALFLLDLMSKYTNNKCFPSYYPREIRPRRNLARLIITFVLKLRRCVAIAIGRGSAKHEPPFVTGRLAIAEDRITLGDFLSRT